MGGHGNIDHAVAGQFFCGSREARNQSVLAMQLGGCQGWCGVRSGGSGFKFLVWEARLFFYLLKITSMWNIMKYHDISWHIMKYHEISWNIMKYHEISWNIMKYHEISWNIMTYHEISWNIMKYHEISWNIMKYDMVANFGLFRSAMVGKGCGRCARCALPHGDLNWGFLTFWGFPCHIKRCCISNTTYLGSWSSPYYDILIFLRNLCFL